MKTKLSYSNLEFLLGQFDGKHFDLLDRVAADYPAELSLLLHLARFAEQAEPPAQTAATALLKRYLVAGFVSPTILTGRLLDLLVSTTHWESRLHLLQVLPVLSIPGSQADLLFRHLSGWLSDHNKFMRAWAYSGLHRVAFLHAEYRPQVAALLQQAGFEESASVRARLRHLPPLELMVARCCPSTRNT